MHDPAGLGEAMERSGQNDRIRELERRVAELQRHADVNTTSPNEGENGERTMSDYDEMAERKAMSDREGLLQHGNAQYRPGPRQAHANVPYGAGPVGAELGVGASSHQQALVSIYQELNELNAHAAGCFDHINGLANRLMGERDEEDQASPIRRNVAAGTGGIVGEVAEQVAELHGRLSRLHDQICRLERL